jgi:arylsulfatase A-like enzyme
MKLKICITLFLISFISLGAAEKPNIMLILVDDMGYSDLGCFGGEIKTPNIDKLAYEGIRYTQFTNCAKCETTRTTLMSGRYHPEARDGKNTITIPEAMKQGGYQTFMLGKWHIFDHPSKRGFDRFYGFANGAVNFFTCESTATIGKSSMNQTLEEDGKKLKVPDDFYCTTDFTNKALTYLDERDKKKPFFMYMAYNAPHYPLQAPKDQVMKYRGKYKEGWHKLRETRLKKMKELGILSEGQKLSDSSAIKKWEDQSADVRDLQDLLMATYAAMVDMVDQNVGRLVQKLKDEKIYENTLIVFLSDNGACPFDRTTKETLSKNLMPWDKESFYCYTTGWAHACNTPFYKFKQNQNEGGISTGMISHWPKGIKKPGRFDRDRAHLVDLHTTFIDLAGVEYPKEFNGNPVKKARGLSLAKSYAGEARPLHDELFYEFGSKYSALWSKEWKIVDNKYLYNIKEDRIESNDLRGEYPEKFEEMKKRWMELKKEMGGKSKGKKKKKK